jgi:hypothetical protein
MPSPLGSGFISPIKEEMDMDMDSAPMISAAAVEQQCLGAQTTATRSQFPLMPGTVQQAFGQASEQKAEIYPQISLPSSTEAAQRVYPRPAPFPHILPYQYVSSNVIEQQKREAPSPITTYAPFTHPQVSPEAAFHFFSQQAHHSDPGWWTRIPPEQGEIFAQPLHRQQRNQPYPS